MDESAVTVRLSPSASLNTPARETSFVPLSLTMVASVMAEATAGTRLGVGCCWAAVSISFSALATSTQRVPQSWSARACASAAVIGVIEASATVSPKASSARSQRSVCSL